MARVYNIQCTTTHRVYNNVSILSTVVPTNWNLLKVERTCLPCRFWKFWYRKRIAFWWILIWGSSFIADLMVISQCEYLFWKKTFCFCYCYWKVPSICSSFLTFGKWPLHWYVLSIVLNADKDSTQSDSDSLSTFDNIYIRDETLIAVKWIMVKCRLYIRCMFNF